MVHGISDEASDESGAVFDVAGLGVDPGQHFWREEQRHAFHAGTCDVLRMVAGCTRRR